MSWKDKFSKFRWLAQLLMGSRNRDRSSASQRFLMIVTVSIVFFLVWASVSEFDQVVTAEAKVIPFSKLQTVQHFEGGIIKEIHVKAGQYVKQGEPLVSLSPLEAGGSYQAKR